MPNNYSISIITLRYWSGSFIQRTNFSSDKGDDINGRTKVRLNIESDEEDLEPEEEEEEAANQLPEGNWFNLQLCF